MKDDKTKEMPSMKGPMPADRTMKIRMPEDGDAGAAGRSGREAEHRADPDESTERVTSTLGATYPEAMIRLRMSSHDAHYGGNLVDGARMLALFGDIATELLIRHDGDEGLFRAYESVEFLAPVRAGDYVEAVGRIIKVGNTSRQMSFEAWKVITPAPAVSDSAADLLREPVLVCRAVGTCVVPVDKQRKK